MIMRLIRKPGPKKKPHDVLVSRRITKFISKIDTSSECHIWKGAKARNGCPHVLSPWTRQPTTAARIVYQLKCGSVDNLDRIKVCCKTSWCLNPNHLQLIKPGYVKNEKKNKLPSKSLFS